MQLAPVTQAAPSPSYPRRAKRKITAHWLRKAIATAAAVGSLGLMACSGGLPWVHGEELGGVVAEPWPEFYSFACEDDLAYGEVELDSINPPATETGYLCGEELAIGRIAVAEQGVYQIRLETGVEHAAVALISPHDVHVAQLDVDQPTINVELAPGSWTLEVSAVDPVLNPGSAFSIAVDRLE